MKVIFRTCMRALIIIAATILARPLDPNANVPMDTIFFWGLALCAWTILSEYKTMSLD